ncbi:MAG: hypothetical protein AAFP79_04925 [Pseudomonadota bacterium]
MNKQDREGFEQLAKALREQTEAMNAQTEAIKELAESAPALLELAKKSPVLIELATNYEGARWFTKFVKWLAPLAAGFAVFAFLGQLLFNSKL